MVPSEPSTICPNLTPESTLESNFISANFLIKSYLILILSLF